MIEGFTCDRNTSTAIIYNILVKVYLTFLMSTNRDSVELLALQRYVDVGFVERRLVSDGTMDSH